MDFLVPKLSATMEEATMIRVTTASCPRYAVNNRPIRDSDTDFAWAFSAALAVRDDRPRPAELTASKGVRPFQR